MDKKPLKSSGKKQSGASDMKMDDVVSSTARQWGV
jgi:hypothetical protein